MDLNVQKLLRYWFAASALALIIGGDAMAQKQFHTTGNVGRWNLFRDGNYCWMTSEFVPGGRHRKMLLMVDSEGEVIIHLNPKRSMRSSKWEGISLSAGSLTFAFVDEHGWGVNPQKDQSGIRRALFSSRRADFDAVLIHKSKRVSMKGYFNTGKGAEAYKKMVETCG
ncbi:hypothetical protein [Ruegeria jejuensis]|uniref:hypothetical protein n=1 Tax=Ruegeria jejuensis TaxID=3233338 RepID=UPI00355C2C05